MVDDLRPGQYLQFVEITATDGAITRFVDLADPHETGTPGAITFRTYDYTPMKMAVPVSEEGTDGATPSSTLEVVDPTYTLLAWATAHENMIDAAMRVDVIRYDDIADAANGRTRTYRIREFYTAEGPPRIGISYGSPVLRQFKYPRCFFSRNGCWNDYQHRYVHDGLQRCTAGSDEFGPQTEQNLKWIDDSSTPTGEVDVEYGWYTLNSAAIGSGSDWLTNDTTTSDRRMKCESVDSTAIWDGVDRGGPYLYRKFAPGTGFDEDFDCYTKITIGTGADDCIAGILIQGDATADNDDWLFWGAFKDGGTMRYLRRQTTTNVSSDSTTAGSHRGFRVARSGSTFTLYTSDTGLTDEDPVTSWTQVEQRTWAHSGTLRVGLAIGREVAGSLEIQGAFYYFRLTAGGYDTCDKSLAACTTRDNLHQRNGFLGMPDGTATF